MRVYVFDSDMNYIGVCTHCGVTIQKQIFFGINTLDGKNIIIKHLGKEETPSDDIDIHSIWRTTTADIVTLQAIFNKSFKFSYACSVADARKNIHTEKDQQKL